MRARDVLVRTRQGDQAPARAPPASGSISAVCRTRHRVRAESAHGPEFSCRDELRARPHRLAAGLDGALAHAARRRRSAARGQSRTAPSARWAQRPGRRRMRATTGDSPAAVRVSASSGSSSAALPTVSSKAWSGSLAEVDSTVWGPLMGHRGGVIFGLNARGGLADAAGGGPATSRRDRTSA